jgi:hypothetical protein
VPAAKQPSHSAAPNAAGFACNFHLPRFLFSTLIIVMAICITFGTHGE